MLLNNGLAAPLSIKCICIQSRHNMVEVYNKQSLKTVQQHVSTLNTHVTKYRSVAVVCSYCCKANISIHQSYWLIDYKMNMQM